MSFAAGAFFLPRDEEFAWRTFGICRDELELFLLERCRPIQKTGCWEWTGSINSENGYGSFRWSGHRHTYYAHRVSCELYNGPFTQARPWALHSCDNPPCMNPEHLWAGSPSENTQDAVNKGRWKAVRFTEEDAAARVDAVFRLRAAGLTQQSIGDEIGLSQSQVSLILLGKFSYSSLRRSA